MTTITRYAAAAMALLTIQVVMAGPAAAELVARRSRRGRGIGLVPLLGGGCCCLVVVGVIVLVVVLLKRRSGGNPPPAPGPR